MKKMTILALVLALTGFGFVGTAAAGFSVAVGLNCGDKVTGCFNALEWQAWFECGSLWEEFEELPATEVNLPLQVAMLEAREVDFMGRCSNEMLISIDEDFAGDDELKQYETGCTLASNAGGNGKNGGKHVSLTVTVLGPGDCPVEVD